jgi:hypothetical protein
MIRTLLVLLATLLPAAAETARVISGEHGDFTRLVIELPAGQAWTMGRTDTGYAFAETADVQPAFDLASVWQRIDRSRLSALQVDPATGVLNLSLGCDCHIFPFEYQPGIVVLDITPGPAPATSVFESAFVPPGADKVLPKESAARPTYDWLKTAEAPQEMPVATLPLPLETGGQSLKPLRDALLEQIARGAADGIVDMELPGKPAKVAEAAGSPPWANVRIGEDPGVIVTEPNGLVPEPRPDAPCAAPDLLDLSSWGDDRPAEELLAETRGSLFGEFDRPDDAAVLHAVRLLLYLGFGAEAAQTADLMETPAKDGSLDLYRSMARLIDGETDPQTPFAGMLDCDGPSALWAALAHDRLPPGPGVNRDAIIQAFQALPPHLRLHLGPVLAEKFLARDDAEAARIVRDAVERAPESDPAEVALLDAQAELHGGDTDAAIAHAEAAVALDGDQAEGLLTLVDSHFRKLEPMGPDTATALQSLQGEAEGTERSAAIDRAVVLALALSDQTEAAFAQGPLSGGVERDLWQVVATRSADDDFLRHAVLAPGSERPGVASAVAVSIGQRLLALGFSDAALVWIGPVGPDAAPELRLLAASAEAARGNAQVAADLLVGVQGSEAAGLRAKVQVQLGDLASASAGLSEAGDVEAAARLNLWGGDWTAATNTLPAAWQAAAPFADPTTIDPAAGLLGRGAKTVEASLASRDAIAALLSSVPSPTGK